MRDSPAVIGGRGLKHNAQELRKALFEGYNFQDDPLKVVKPLPKYLQGEFDKFKAAALKTPALRAAYLEAIRKAEAGAGMDALEKALRVAFYERNRYFANRIARTELHRNYTDQVARELMEEEEIEYVQIRMSSKHPKTDICDRHAKLDAYGLGPGVYPKADAPRPPFHPHCYCVVSPRIDLDPKTPPRFNLKAEQAFLAKLDPKEARDIAGSWDKLKRAKGGEPLEDIYNEGKDPLYRWRRVGDIMSEIPPQDYPSIARSTRERLKSREFHDFFNGRSPDNEFPVAVLPPDEQALLGAANPIIQLSRISLDEHKAKHPEIGLDDYQKIQEIVETGEMYQQNNYRYVLLKQDDQLYRAAFKVTQDKEKLYFLTLFRTTEELADLQVRQKFKKVR